MRIFNLSLDSTFSQVLGQSIKEISGANERAAKQAMSDLANQTYVKAQEMAGQRLHRTKQKYIDNLSYNQQSENVFQIILGKDAAFLEEGFPSYDMIKAGLARGPKSKMTKDGRRYVVIPFEHTEAAATPGHAMENRPVQIGQPTQTTMGNLARDLQLLKATFDDRGTTKYPSGSPVLGKVYSVDKSPVGPTWLYTGPGGESKSAMMQDRQPHHTLVRLTKYQTQDRPGGKVRSTYMTFRTATDPKHPESMDKWIHPGFPSGAKVFPDLERWAIEQLTRRIKEIFGS